MFCNQKDHVIVVVEIIDGYDIRMLDAIKNTRLFQDIRAVVLSNINQLKV